MEGINGDIKFAHRITACNHRFSYDILPLLYLVHTVPILAASGFIAKFIYSRDSGNFCRDASSSAGISFVDIQNFFLLFVPETASS